MEAKEFSLADAVPKLSRTQRDDFQETSDPALESSAARGKANLLGYTELYELWERQQWLTQDLDFSQDRVDWHERIPEDERYRRMYGLSAFFLGEQKVADELGPIMRAAPTEEMRIFLATQIVDEARHVRFFERFYCEVGVLEGTEDLAGRLEETEQHTNEAFAKLFDGLLKTRVDRLAAEPEDTGDAGRDDHALPHGHRGGPGAHRAALHHRVQHAGRHASRLRRGLLQRRSRRAPPHRLRRPLPHRHGGADDRYAPRSSACWRRRCRSPTGS